MTGRRRSHQKGLTLVEILIALLVVAILAAASIPYMGHYLNMRRVEGGAQAVYADLMLAHKHATTQQAAVTVVFQTGANWCVGLSSAGSCDCATAGNCNLGHTTSASYKNVSLSASGFGGGTSTVLSASRGTATTTGTLTLTVGSDAINVELNQMGFARMCANNGIGGFDPC